MDELPRLSRTHRKAAIQVALWSTRWLNRLSARAEGRFSMHPKGREGAAACPGPLKMHRVPQKAVLRTECLRKRVAYHRRLFCAPNICSVPEKGVSGTEYHSRTRKGCSAHRVPLKMRRVPQEPVFCTARIFRTPGGPLRYRMSLPYMQGIPDNPCPC